MVHDALVIGLGAMGSAALRELARAGARAIGVDRFAPPHTLGSTHGRSRIIREAYYEHPSYVPLVRRAYVKWAELERESGVRLFQETGGLMIGAPESGLIRGTLESVARHGIAVEQLSTGDIARRFPALSADAGMVGVLEKRAGVLLPEACVRAALDSATARGAVVRTGCTVVHIARTGDGSVVATMSDGDAVRARRVVLAAGAWAPALLASIGFPWPLVVERQTMHWLARGGLRLGPDSMPLMMVEHDAGRFFYCIPDLGDGVKAAIHHEGAIVSPDAPGREVTDDDRGPVRALVERYIPGAESRIVESAVCLYTDAPDMDFALGPLDGLPEVVVVSACSGHGFKFASAIGEIAAQMALGESPSLDVSRFSPSRFATSTESRSS